jgi:hypothetical protein
MALPSDPDYIPAATDHRVLSCSLYLDLLAMNTDPYALHSYAPSAIEMIEEFAFSAS